MGVFQDKLLKLICIPLYIITKIELEVTLNLRIEIVKKNC